MCIVCGVDNDASMRAAFFDCENNGKKVLLTVVQPNHKQIHQSYPGRMHGGMISALLDESIGRAIQIDDPDIWAVTIDLVVKFRKPVPLDQTIYLDSRITASTKRSFDGEGKLFLADGTVCATATARYLVVPLEKIITDADSAHEIMVTVDEPIPECFKF